MLETHERIRIQRRRAGCVRRSVRPRCSACPRPRAAPLLPWPSALSGEEEGRQRGRGRSGGGGGCAEQRGGGRQRRGGGSAIPAPLRLAARGGAGSLARTRAHPRQRPAAACRRGRIEAGRPRLIRPCATAPPRSTLASRSAGPPVHHRPACAAAAWPTAVEKKGRRRSRGERR